MVRARRIERDGSHDAPVAFRDEWEAAAEPAGGDFVVLVGGQVPESLAREVGIGGVKQARDLGDGIGRAVFASEEPGVGAWRGHRIVHSTRRIGTFPALKSATWSGLVRTPTMTSTEMPGPHLGPPEKRYRSP